MDTKTYWERQPTDNPYTINGFNGTWNISDHSLVSSELRNYLLEAFHPESKFKRIPLDAINTLLNEVWEGPGSMVKIERLHREMYNERMAAKLMGDEDTKTKTAPKKS